MRSSYWRAMALRPSMPRSRSFPFVTRLRAYAFRRVVAGLAADIFVAPT
jgi:hypothetical protein